MVWRGARFNLRFGRVALIVFWELGILSFLFGVTVDDGLARGALQPALWERCVD